MLAHPRRTHRIRHRPLLPLHRYQMGQRQTRRTHRTIHHRPMAPTSPRPQLNSYAWIATSSVWTSVNLNGAPALKGPLSNSSVSLISVISVSVHCETTERKHPAD